MAGPHHRGTFPARAAKVRAAADADPLTRCWRCGEGKRPGDPWQAGHVFDGDPSSPLLAEHRSCNTRAGNQVARGRFRNSRRW